MTKLQIISRQWSSIYDLLLYIQDKEKAKSLEDIQQDLDIIEYSCRKYADVDDEEISMENEQISRAEHEEFRKRIEAEDNRQNIINSYIRYCSWNYCKTVWIIRRSKMFKNCVFKPSVDTVKWWKKAGIRAVKTMAQTAVGVIGAGSVISAVDWKMVVSSAVVAGVVSLLTSVAGIPEVEADENLNNLFSDGTK